MSQRSKWPELIPGFFSMKYAQEYCYSPLDGMLQSWTKMVRKIHLVCFILEYFTPKTGTVKILTPPPPKNKVEGSPEHFWCIPNNTDQGGVEGGATIMLNSLGVTPVYNKV